MTIIFRQEFNFYTSKHVLDIKNIRSTITSTNSETLHIPLSTILLLVPGSVGPFLSTSGIGNSSPATTSPLTKGPGEDPFRFAGPGAPRPDLGEEVPRWTGLGEGTRCTGFCTLNRSTLMRPCWTVCFSSTMLWNRLVLRAMPRAGAGLLTTFTAPE